MNPTPSTATPAASSDEHPTASAASAIYIDRELNRPAPTSAMLGEFVRALLERVSRLLNPELVERALGAARNCGQWAVFLATGLTLVYAIFAAIKYNSFGIFVAGLVLTAALAIAQLTATRFLQAAATSIAGTPSRIVSMAFLECTGLLALLAATGILIGGLVTAIQLSSFVAFLPALVLSAGLTCFGAVALHPVLVNVAIGEGSAGEEALGLFSFFAKTALKLVPLFFCLLAVGGCLAIVASFFQAGQSFANTVGAVARGLPMPANAPAGLAGAAVVLIACLLPFVGYFLFLLQYLSIDVLRAILSVPGKFDVLKR